MKEEICSFEIGDVVFYMPSSRAISLDANCPEEHKLQIGKAYRVQSISDGLYVTVEGYNHRVCRSPDVITIKSGIKYNCTFVGGQYIDYGCNLKLV